ncbi:MAG: hypothetical protein V7K14_01125 [Nostoc sp.]|uniref:hypothetical protein n=1 Tax=unclassified Nostoc TaxID=2593658 RepID=UPI0025FF6ECD|nr:hypothetical protein [Nostoc sp. NMS7]MBN3945590.1 hypothetical protein [Nostoc sp. NMS7]
MDFFVNPFSQGETLRERLGAVAHGGNPQDPYGFASRFKSGNPPNALAHRAASPKSKIENPKLINP